MIPCVLVQWSQRRWIQISAADLVASLFWLSILAGKGIAWRLFSPLILLSYKHLILEKILNSHFWYNPAEAPINSTKSWHVV